MKNTVLRSLPLCLLATAALAQDPKPLDWHGTPLTLPTGWTTQQAEEILLLMPAGNQQEGSGEAYGLLFDPDSKSLDGDDLLESIDGAAEAIAPGSTRQGAAQRGKFGDVDGLTLRYTARLDNGQSLELRMHVYLAKDGAAALFALGLPDKLKARDAELKGLLDSIGKQAVAKPKKRFGLGKKDEPATPPATEPQEPATQNPLAKPRPDNPLAQPQSGDNPLAGSHTRIPGGQEVSWQGVQLDIPAGWRSQAGDEGTVLLLPPGFGQSGVLDEIFALCGDGSIASLDAPDLVTLVQQALDEVQPGLAASGQPKSVKFGALPGKELVYAGRTPDGQQVQAVVRVFPTQGGVRALLALGFPQKLQARSPEVQAILGSLHADKQAAQGGVAQELVGQWVYFSKFDAVNGGGSMTTTTLTLRGDGSFVYDSENSNTNPLGGTASQSHIEGAWSVAGTNISFRSKDGVTTYRLEKRNHPKNRQDPMILLDGKAFVTATQRKPW